MSFSVALRATSLPHPRMLCRSNPAPRRTLPRTTRVAPAFLFCGFAARSFSSCLPFAARTLPRPCRSPSHSGQPRSHFPVCCVDPILRRAEPYPVRHALRLPSCFAGSRRGASLRRFVPVPPLHPVRISLPRDARCSMLDPRYDSYRTRPYRLVPRMTRARACLFVLRVRGAELLFVPAAYG